MSHPLTNITPLGYRGDDSGSTRNAPWSDRFEEEVDLVEDFLLGVGDTIVLPWALNAQTANITVDFVEGVAFGAIRILSDSTSEAQAANLTWGDDLHINMSNNPIIEFRVRVSFNSTDTTLSADERIVIGLGSAHTNAEDALDSVTTNCWFRIEGASNNILVEADDGTNDTNDQDSDIDLVDEAWTLFKIDASDLSNIKYYVDNVEQTGGVVTMGSLAANTYVQPIVCYQRDAGTEAQTIDIDYIRVRVNRD